MTWKRIISVLMVVLLAVSVMSGCEGRNYVVDKYDAKAEIKTLSSQVVAENERFTLTYNDDFKGILLTNKASGKVWSNLRFDENNEPVETSTLDLSLQDMKIYQSIFKGGSTLSAEGRISVQKIENGVEFTYYFDDVKIAVPVKYTLAEDSLKMSIDASKIKEGDPQFRVVYAMPSPHLCEIKKDVEDAYIFTPYGNGSLVSTKVNADGERKFEEGPENFASLITESVVNLPETAKMPVYGLKDADNAIFCIAEETPAALGLAFSAGNRTGDYSNVKPHIYLADYDYFQGRAANAGSVRQLSARTENVITIGVYPLSGEDANYNGMAKCYRNYLQKNGFIEKSELQKSPYSVTILGGVMSTSSIMGIPVSTLKTLTTVNKAQEIMGNITEMVGQKPLVVLKGYGESGVNVGKIGGGFKIASQLGSNKDYKALLGYAEKNNYSVFTNFEMNKYTQSGNGFSYTRDAAKTAIDHAAEKSPVTTPLREFDVKQTYRLLSRREVGNAVDKLINFTNKLDMSGVTLSSFGTVAYSDYIDKEKPYSLSTGVDVDFKANLKKLRENKKTVTGNASAYYAAGLLDAVFETDLEGDGSYQFDKQVPFYQMVFSGSTPMYTKAINLEAQPEKTIMQAATLGMGLGFTVIDDFEKTYMETNAEKLYGCVYDSVKERIGKYVKSYEKVYAQIGGVKLLSYDILENGVTVSTFENGKVVYANQTANEVETAVGILKAYEFKLGGEA